ncbi:hypothetical protein [Nonomuraea sp. JJY05]|uniref:hypothetical protein n=1 Tax=Nonomuraea sp. JJY05 TaxID=3350255 RepID=UPI00373E14BE
MRASHAWWRRVASSPWYSGRSASFGSSTAGTGRTISHAAKASRPSFVATTAVPSSCKNAAWMSARTRTRETARPRPPFRPVR